TTMVLPEAYRLLTTTHNELACVVDEYGGFAGILTIEDLAEELVGGLQDGHDQGEPPPVTPRDDGTWVVAGDLHVDEAERAVGHDLPALDVETVAGLAISARGSLPEPGTAVTVELPRTPSELVLDEPPQPPELHIE